MNELTAITFGLQAFVTLLVILDPPGAAPLFLSLMGSRPRKVQVRMAWLAATTSLLMRWWVDACLNSSIVYPIS